MEMKRQLDDDDDDGDNIVSRNCLGVFLAHGKILRQLFAFSGDYNIVH